MRRIVPPLARPRRAGAQSVCTIASRWRFRSRFLGVFQETLSLNKLSYLFLSSAMEKVRVYEPNGYIE
jgi:hypothetical protein